MSENLAVKAYELRQNILDIVMAGKCGHIGGDMSVIDILTVLYDRMNVSPEHPDDPDRDRFVLSKGHCVEALYAVLCDKGFLPLVPSSNFLERDNEYQRGELRCR